MQVDAGALVERAGTREVDNWLAGLGRSLEEQGEEKRHQPLGKPGRFAGEPGVDGAGTKRMHRDAAPSACSRRDSSEAKESNMCL
jgi:hypothetical protein